MEFKRGHPYPGLWINFEAGEGAGKGTHIKLLEKYLDENCFYVETGREPGGTAIGEQYRIILQNPDMPPLNPKTEILTYVAAGIELFDKAIRPVLEKRGIFLTERWRYSTEAYQGHGLGIDLEVIKILTEFSCDGCYPDLTTLLDIDAKIGLRRVTGHEFGNHRTDKIEARDLLYHERVNAGFREIARENADSFFVVPYVEGDIEGMQNQIRQTVNNLIEQHQLRNKLLRKSEIPNI